MARTLNTRPAGAAPADGRVRAAHFAAGAGTLSENPAPAVLKLGHPAATRTNAGARFAYETRMLQSGPVVSLEDVRARGVDLTWEEAVAIVLQLGRRLSWQIAPPPPHGILLHGDGSVDLRWPHEAGGPTAAAFAALLHPLLPEPRGDRHCGVPGALRMLVARALGTTALPPLASAKEFAAALDRFVAAPDRDAIPARVAAVTHRTIAAAFPVAARSRAMERRVSGPSVNELRRQLQEADLARYFLLSQLGSQPDGLAAVLRAGVPFVSDRAPAAPPRPSARALSLPIHTRGSRTAYAYRERLQHVPVARTVRIAALAVLLVACVVADEPAPALPQPPPLQHAAALPELPVPFALLAAPVPAPAAADHPDALPLREEARIQEVTDAGAPAKTGKTRKRQPNKLLRFVKSLFEA